MTLEELNVKRDAIVFEESTINTTINDLTFAYNEKTCPLKAKRDELTAIRVDLDRQIIEAHAPPVNRDNLCTTSGESPSEVRERQLQEGSVGQHSSYLVLCEEERAKGFVRPYRDKYVHVGIDGQESDPLHPGKHGRTGEGCGVLTSMGRALSETYARDPKFYGATFCCGCNKHLPVAEFVWAKDGERVGS